MHNLGCTPYAQIDTSPIKTTPTLELQALTGITVFSKQPRDVRAELELAGIP
jgi:hypothetical protein